MVLFPKQKPLTCVEDYTHEQEESLSPSQLSKILSEDSFKNLGAENPNSLPQVYVEHDPEEERRLWGEFKQHFRQTKRHRLTANHHDFMFSSNQSEIKRDTLSTAQFEEGVGTAYLSHDHKRRAVTNYNRL
jgi:hypothetical protein